MRIEKRNAQFQLLQALSVSRKKRAELKQFLVEGVIPINILLKSDYVVVRFIAPLGKKLSSWAKKALKHRTLEEALYISEELFCELSDKDTPPEVLALVQRRDHSVHDLLREGASPIWVLCDRPVSPGNLGSLLRSAESFGASGVITYGHGADIYSNKTVSASRGALFQIPHLVGTGLPEIQNFIRQAISFYGELQVIGADEKGSTPLDQVNFTTPTLVLLGNETSELPPKLRELCDHMVSIPMTGTSTSLNVACAGSILLYEASRGS